MIFFGGALVTNVVVVVVLAVITVFFANRAIEYRRINHIPGDWGTAVNVQAMVYGNLAALAQSSERIEFDFSGGSFVSLLGGTILVLPVLVLFVGLVLAIGTISPKAATLLDDLKNANPPGRSMFGWLPKKMPDWEKLTPEEE